MQYRSRRASCLLLLVAALFIATPPGLAQHIIDFSRSTNLKAIYDAGLRPWRVRSDESSTLNITDQQVRIVAPGSSPFTLNVQIGSFGVLEGNQLSKADFISSPTTLADAATKAREACEALGISTKGLEEKVSEFERLGAQTPVPQYWNQREERNGIRCGVTLNPLFGINQTLGKVYVFFEFYKPDQPMKFLTEPIKPPPGYEGVSMEPPARGPRQKPFPAPEYDFDNMRRKIDEAKASERNPGMPATSPKSSHSQPVPKPSSEPADAGQSSSLWPWLLGAILSLIALCGVLFKMTRK